MVQGCQQLRLALKTTYALGVVGKAFGQNLQGNIAAQPDIARAIDFAHRAGAYHSGDLIRADPGPRDEHKGRRCRIFRESAYYETGLAAILGEKRFDFLA